MLFEGMILIWNRNVDVKIKFFFKCMVYLNINVYFVGLVNKLICLYKNNWNYLKKKDKESKWI